MRRNRSVLPHFLAYNTAISKCLIAFLVTFSLWYLWHTKVPVYLDAAAVIVNNDRIPDHSERATIIILFSPEYLNHIRAGHHAFVQSESSSARLQTSILRVESHLSDHAALQRRFNLSNGALLAAPDPAAVAMASFSAPAFPAPLASDSRAVYRVDIEVGRRRIAALVPIIGQWMDDSQ
jgi:hypothetical protein